MWLTRSPVGFKHISKRRKQNQLSLVQVANFQLTKQVRNCRCDNAVHYCNSRYFMQRIKAYVYQWR